MINIMCYILYILGEILKVLRRFRNSDGSTGTYMSLYIFIHTHTQLFKPNQK